MNDSIEFESLKNQLFKEIEDLLDRIKNLRDSAGFFFANLLDFDEREQSIKFRLKPNFRSKVEGPLKNIQNKIEDIKVIIDKILKIENN